ncbi:C25 family cysteine peptidase [Lewinella cohaerens]|uniref:putative type IX secretion system sortase PorU2 n=1 Tax=Lewinella cohaerens TaxID=70995 RepID=UPI00035DA37C|nr:C25 family cysteine peptidase [Lewinella cohaerens]
MRKRFLFIPVYFLFCTISFAQIVDGLDTLYGNEWITTENPHLKLTLTEDNFYRVNYQSLIDQGWPVASINSEDYRLFYAGEAIPYYSTAVEGTPLGVGDFLVFYGQGNRGELDQHLYRNPEAQQLNPEYSLYSDEATYYLSWQSEGGTLQYESLLNDLNNLPGAEPYVWKQAQEIFSDHFMKEYYRFSGATLYYSHFGIGEGYGSRSINELLADGSTIQTVDLALPSAYSNGPEPVLKTRYTAALFQHIQQLKVEGNLIRTDSFYDWRMLNVATNLPVGVLADEELNLEWEGLGGEKDEVSIGFVQLDYPATPDAANTTTYSCRIEPTGDRQYLEITNFAGTSAIVYDLANAYRIVVGNINSGLLRVTLPVAAKPRELRIIALESNLPSPEISTANLQVPDLGDADYLILTHSLLRAGGDDPVQAYANYRASAIGGGYQTAVVNIDDLFDQFGYGVQQHPMAIRNFIAWQRKVNPAFKYLFIIGKGREYIDLRTPANLTAALGTTLFVPSFGYPASDNLLASRIDKPTPLVSLGRLPAINPQEVRLYLNKIQGMETFVAGSPQTIEGRSWMKNVLHLGGGSSPSEQQSIKNNLANMGREIEEGTFGGEVTSFYKTSTDPIQSSQSEGIFGRINEGVSILTFFGHSNANSFDFSIDQPVNYLNTNRYPLMLSLGCYSGNMFTNSRSIGEDFLFLETGGAGAFGASRGLGFIHSLSNFGRHFYDRMSNDYYGACIGDGIRVTIANYENFTDQAYGTLNEQFSLQGDPALRLHPQIGEDYLIAAESVKINPEIVNVQTDSFQLIFDLVNLGRKVTDSISVEISQRLPDGSEVLHFVARVPTVGYQESISFQIPSLGRNSIGINRILIRLDPNNEISELPSAAAESNNELILASGERGVPFYVVDDIAIPVWPPKYSLVGEFPLVLKASTANALSEERKYFFELSTSPNFVNRLAQTEVISSGGVLRWSPSIEWQDSTVYYWRVAPDTIGAVVPTFVWEESSFEYITGIPSGWGQGDWGQWVDNIFENSTIDSISKVINFTDNNLDVAIRNKVYDSNDPPTYYNRDRFIGSPWTWSIHEGLNVVVLPYPTLDYWRNPLGGLYGSVNTASGWESVLPFAYRTEVLEDRTSLINFLTEIVPDSAYVLIYSAQRTLTSDYHPELWAADSLVLDGTNIFNVLEEEGALRVRELETVGSRPYVLFYQKGVEYIGEALAETLQGDAFLDHSFAGLWYEGQMTTIPVGPVESWNRLEVKFLPESLEMTDSVAIVLEGSSDQISWSPIWEVRELAQPFYFYDLTDINVSTTPYLRVRYFAYDIENRTLPQPDFIHIYHNPLAELAINNNLFYSFTDSLSQGQNIELIYAIENLGATAVNNITIDYQVNNIPGVDIQNKTINTLEEDAVYLDTLLVTSRETVGTFEIITTVNPANTPKEYARFNNVNVNRGKTSSDVIDPVVDVTFDGIKILDGDIVAPSPLITIVIEDENLNLPLDDPNRVRLFLQSPENSTPVLVDLSDYNWVPADVTTGENKALIEYQPAILEDGLHLLSIQGQDATGNNAGRLQREVHFEVINKQTISNILPYPNPFSSQTRFVYTLTGNPPTKFGIQIMTVSGRIVKEIGQADFGDLRIGTHQSDYIWDGRDNYGDQLANGVYLYRVIAQDEAGNDLEIRDNSSNTSFRNGLGKIVLLR